MWAGVLLSFLRTRQEGSNSEDKTQRARAGMGNCFLQRAGFTGQSIFTTTTQLCCCNERQDVIHTWMAWLILAPRLVVCLLLANNKDTESDAQVWILTLFFTSCVNIGKLFNVSSGVWCPCLNTKSVFSLAVLTLASYLMSLGLSFPAKWG